MKCIKCGGETHAVEFVYSDGLCGVREVTAVEVCQKCGHVHAPGAAREPDNGKTWTEVHRVRHP